MGFFGRPIRSSLVTAAVWLAVVAGSGVPPAFGRPAPHERRHDAKKQVEALEEQWRSARLTGDVSAMDRLLSEDYIGISMTGQVSTKAQQLERARNRKFVLTRLDLGDMHVKVIGAIAIVTSRADVEGVNEGRAVKGTYRYTRVYQRLATGGWKITSFEATRVHSRESPRNQDAKAANGQPVAEPQ